MEADKNGNKPNNNSIGGNQDKKLINKLIPEKPVENK